jgi:hypothetical protein
MFKDNKYTKCYYSIISKAKSRDISGYTETHHIIPRSLGGDDSIDNLVKLTAREHYICHLLLVKMTYGNFYHKMLYAYTIMSGRDLYNSKKYQFFKEEYTKVNSMLRSGIGNGMYGADRKGEKNTFFGKKHTDESKQKISEKKTGVKISRQPFTESHKSNISKSRTGTGVVYTFFHKEHGKITCNIQELISKFPDIFNKKYHAAELWKLATGLYKTCKGWKVI